MRIEPRRERDCPWYLRPFFWNQRRKYGTALDAALLWARSPRLFVAVAALYGAIDRRSSPIDPALRSLVSVRVSQLSGCPFCVDLNSAALLRRGTSIEKAAAVRAWRDSTLFDERERAVLAYAETVTTTAGEVPEAQFQALRRHFTDDAIVELTALVAFQSMSSKFNAAFEVPPQGFCEIPVRPAATAAATGAQGTHDGQGAGILESRCFGSAAVSDVSGSVPKARNLG